MLDEATVTSRLKGVFEDIFDVSDFPIKRELTADHVEDWDSLTHVRLILATENEFGINFTASEIEGLQDVGKLIDIIRAKS